MKIKFIFLNITFVAQLLLHKNESNNKSSWVFLTFTHRTSRCWAFKIHIIFFKCYRWEKKAPDSNMKWKKRNKIDGEESDVEVFSISDEIDVIQHKKILIERSRDSIGFRFLMFTQLQCIVESSRSFSNAISNNNRTRTFEQFWWSFHHRGEHICKGKLKIDSISLSNVFFFQFNHNQLSES